MVLFKMMRFSNTIPATFAGIFQHFRVSALDKKSSESLELSLLIGPWQSGPRHIMAWCRFFLGWGTCETRNGKYKKNGKYQGCLNGGCLGFQNHLGDEMMKVEKLKDVPMM